MALTLTALATALAVARIVFVLYRATAAMEELKRH